MPFSYRELQTKEQSTEEEEKTIISFSSQDFNKHQFIIQAKEYILYTGVFFALLFFFLGIWYAMPSFLSSDHTKIMTLQLEKTSLHAEITDTVPVVKAVYE